MIKIAPMLIICFILGACSSKDEEVKEEKKPTTSEIANAFVTLNDKIETSQSIIESSINNDLKKFDEALKNLKTASDDEIQQLNQLETTVQSIRSNTIRLSNFFIQQSSDLIKYSGDPQFGKKDCDSKPLEHHYEIIKGNNNQDRYQLLPLEHLERKDDIQSASELSIGKEDFTFPKGMYIIESIEDYRNRICMLIANYKDAEGENWNLKDSSIRLTDDSEEAKSHFNRKLSSILIDANPKDTLIIKQIFQILSPPYETVSYGEYLPYIVKLFDQTPLIAAITMFRSLESDAKTAESMAIHHLTSRLESPTFNFNKIEPLAFAHKSLIPSGDTVGLQVMIAVYDTLK